MPRDGGVVVRSVGRKTRLIAINDKQNDRIAETNKNKHNSNHNNSNNSNSSNAGNSDARNNSKTARNDSSVGSNSASSNSATINSDRIRSGNLANVMIAGSNSANNNSRTATGNVSANNSSSNNSSSNSNVASRSGTAIAIGIEMIAIETGTTGAITIPIVTTPPASVIGNRNNNSARSAISRTGSDGRITCTSASVCSSSRD